MSKHKKMYIDDWLVRQLAVEKIQHSEAKRLIRRLIRVVVIFSCLAIAGITSGFWAIGQIQAQNEANMEIMRQKVTNPLKTVKRLVTRLIYV